MMDWSVLPFMALFLFVQNNMFVAAVPTGPRTLVLQSSPAVQESHGAFFKILKARGKNLVFKGQDEVSSLYEGGDLLFDNLIIFSSTSKISKEELRKFVDRGGNVLIAVDGYPKKGLRSFANECGVDFDGNDGMLVDAIHVNELIPGSIATQHLTKEGEGVIGKQKESSISYRGIGMVLDDLNELVMPILTGEWSTHSIDKGGVVSSIGADAVLVSAVQARNNARVAFCGSLLMFSDEYFNAGVKVKSPASSVPSSKKSGNMKFAEELTKWTFGDKNVVRAKNVRHHRYGSQISPAQYRIGDTATFEADLEEYDMQSKSWRPYMTEQLHMELTMLDAYYHVAMEHEKEDKSGHYSTILRLPDVPGVFQYKLQLDAPGITTVMEASKVVIRPYRHDEHERFIFAAFPYYISSISMMVGGYFFGVVYLYHK